MTHVDPRHVERSLESMESHIDKALEATDTRDMTTNAGYAQAAAVELEHYLQDDLDSRAFPQNERDAVKVAVSALSDAVVMGEKVALGVDVPSMRSRVIDFKTAVDTATLRVREALKLQ